jgi:superfamily II DNA or RNA helicase
VSAAVLPLRQYQGEGVAAVEDAWKHGVRRPAVVWPTGAGKTVGFAHLGARHLSANPRGRVLAIAHTTELLDQMMGKFRSVAPGYRVGRVQANANETLARIVCASVQTLRNPNRRRMIRDVSMIIIDEAHHAVAQSYLDVIEHYGGFVGAGQPGALVVGFTATMKRGDDLALGRVWQDVVHELAITDMIREGWLVRPVGLHVQVDDLDLSQVRTSRGDYREGDLGEALEQSLAPTAIAKAVAEHANDRKILLFAPTVSSAGVIADALRASGRSVGLIHGAMARADRQAALDAFRAWNGHGGGGTQVLANCQILTEGFDEPSADCVVIARPTRSPVLYQQIAGRVLRPYPGKTDALLLDVVGATKVHSLVSGIELFGEDGEPKEPKTRNLLEWEDPDELDGDQQDARRALLGGHDGPLIATEVDLFARSSMAWMRTRAGVYFLEGADRYIVIVPGAPRTADQWLAHFDGRPAGFDVVSLYKTQSYTERVIVDGVADLQYAMAWADQDVSPGERTTAARDRSWRAKDPSKSPKLMALAERLRLHVPPGARMGEVSTMVSVALATKRIDSWLYARGAQR